MQSLCHYERLGVPSGADEKTLRQAFRRRSKALHPDTTSLPEEQAVRDFQLLKESYELLIDSRRRLEYDNQLKELSAFGGRCSSQNEIKNKYSIGQRRPLSGGEWFSLVLLTIALLLSLILGLGVALTQGRAWQVSPDWLGNVSIAFRGNIS